MTVKILAALLLVLLAACGESGSDPKGPFQAYLMLQDSSGAVRDFHLGGYNSLEDCVELLEFEVSAYEQEYGRKFYTNAEIDYGGHKSDELFVEHLIVGARCVERG